jgi:TIR domain
MADVFLSYSRRDREFALRLHGALVDRGKDGWIDEEDIPPTARWRDELREAIEAGDSFLFLISPDSAASPQCSRELEHAEELNKRVIGVMVRATPPERLPETLAARQFVPQRGEFDDDFARSLQTLVAAIDTDLEWVKAHTQWGRKALEWEAHEHDASFLLSGSELDEAERWIARQSGKQPAPTELQATYVLRSRQRTTRRLRSTRAAISVALIVAVALSVIALLERANAVANENTAQSRELAASAEKALASDPELSTLLALRGLELSPTAQAQTALRDAMPQLQLLDTLTPRAALYSPSFSPEPRSPPRSAPGSSRRCSIPTAAR